MAAYRCFHFGFDDRIVGMDVCDQPDDDAASRWGAALLDREPNHRAIEVWQLSRRVVRLGRQPAPMP
jgi:hypothetical protein